MCVDSEIQVLVPVRSVLLCANSSLLVLSLESETHLELGIHLAISPLKAEKASPLDVRRCGACAYGPFLGAPGVKRRRFLPAAAWPRTILINININSVVTCRRAVAGCANLKRTFQHFRSIYN